jgi:hypothetical protein
MARTFLAVSCLLTFLSLLAAVGGGAHAQEPTRDRHGSGDHPDVTPELGRSTVETQGRVVKALKADNSAAIEHTAGPYRFSVRADTVRAFKSGSDAPIWTTKTSNGTHLVWLASDETAIYFAGFTRSKDSKDYLPDSPARIRRLDHASGKWLEDLAVGGKVGEKEQETIADVVGAKDCVTVLTVVTDQDRQLAAYRIWCFRPGETRPLWSKSFPSAGKLARPGAFLLFSTGSPEKAVPDVRPLSWMGDNVLVCAGPVQDLICLNGDTGEVKWRVPRVWEYDRDFIGPSVWQHQFVRPGGTGEDEAPKPKTGEGKKTRSDGSVCSIIGGPAVVEIDRATGQHSVFLAVARGSGTWAGYLSESVVYELSESGEPVGMVKLPRLVKSGGKFRASSQGVVWACQDGDFVKLSPTRDRPAGFGMGPGGPNLLCRVAWYRHGSQDLPGAWLTAGPAGDPIAFGEEFAFRADAGGYVASEDSGVYSFPMTAINLRTGTDSSLVLRVPFKGKLAPPHTNYSRSTTTENKASWHCLGPHVMGITRLQVAGKRLRVTIGTEGSAGVVEFAVEELVRTGP